MLVACVTNIRKLNENLIAFLKELPKHNLDLLIIDKYGYQDQFRFLIPEKKVTVKVTLDQRISQIMGKSKGILDMIKPDSRRYIPSYIRSFDI